MNGIFAPRKPYAAVATAAVYTVGGGSIKLFIYTVLFALEFIEFLRTSDI